MTQSEVDAIVNCIRETLEASPHLIQFSFPVRITQGEVQRDKVATLRIGGDEEDKERLLSASEVDDLAHEFMPPELTGRNPATKMSHARAFAEHLYATGALRKLTLNVLADKRLEVCGHADPLALTQWLIDQASDADFRQRHPNWFLYPKKTI